MTNTKTQSQRLREIRAAGIRQESYSQCVLDRRCISNSNQTNVSLLALQMELKNYLEHGRPQHDGDWYHEWSRTGSGTLSWNC